MTVSKLTTQQANALINTQFVTDNYYNPIEDLDGNLIISVEEVEMSPLGWIKNLPLIEFNPVPQMP